MTHADTVLAVLGTTALVLLTVGAVLVGWWGRRKPVPPPPTDPDALTLCVGCMNREGCTGRHRIRWMDWTTDGRYRCTVCCRKDHETDG